MTTAPIASLLSRKASKAFDKLFAQQDDVAAKRLFSELTAAIERAERSVTGPHDCRRCDGDGRVAVRGLDPRDGADIVTTRCLSCSGSGMCAPSSCTACIEAQS